MKTLKKILWETCENIFGGTFIIMRRTKDPEEFLEDSLRELMELSVSKNISRNHPGLQEQHEKEICLDISRWNFWRNSFKILEDFPAIIPERNPAKFLKKSLKYLQRIPEEIPKLIFKGIMDILLKKSLGNH